MAQEHWLTDDVFVVKALFSRTECQEMIRMSEDIGYEDALVNTPDGQVLRRDVRNNQRIVFRSDEMADQLWEKVRDFVPWEYNGRTAVGLNEMLRFYRYDPGQLFNWHQDFPFERDNGECSFFTLMIYLNGGFEGGETAFEDSYSEESFDDFSVTPEEGMALLFVHATHHKGEAVRSGRKYVLRTDVMYAAEADEEQDDFGEFDDVDEW